MDAPVAADASPPNPPAASDWTVRKVLEWTTAHLKKHGSDTPRLDAEILLAHARKCQRIQLYTAYDEPLSDAVRATMRDLVQRRAQAEPVAYLVGRREFFSLNFRVTRDVLIPRPDTETLVLKTIDVLNQRRAVSSGGDTPQSVLELCTGSGCVSVAVARQCQAASLAVRIVATDLSDAALQIARENADQHAPAAGIEFAAGDLFAAVAPDRRFDVIVSNPPYVPTAEIETLDPEVSRHEPRLALDGGADGLDVIRRIVAESPAHATENAVVLLEFSPEQANAIESLFRDAGYRETTVHKDLAGRARVITARVP